MTIVFYDVENINISKKGEEYGLEAAYQSIIDLPDIGEILEHRAYFTQYEHGRKLEQFFQGLSSVLIEIKKPTKAKKRMKDYVDFHIFSDALNFAHTRPEITCFVLVSNDSDFLVLAERLTRMNKKAITLKKNLIQSNVPGQPEVYATKKIPAKAKFNESSYVRRIVKMCSHEYTHIKVFDLLLNGILEECMGDETGRAILAGSGINISILYQNIKNVFGQKKISYKQNGEKKMHLAFARALLDSEFCVVQRGALFFVMEKESAPEDAAIILPQDEHGETQDKSIDTPCQA